MLFIFYILNCYYSINSNQITSILPVQYKSNFSSKHYTGHDTNKYIVANIVQVVIVSLCQYPIVTTWL